MDFDDREAAALGIGAALLLGVPAVIGGVLLIATGWVALLGGHPHGPIWGWLSEVRKDKQGNTVYDVGFLPLYYGFLVINVYLVYQLCELTYAGFKALQREMA